MKSRSDDTILLAKFVNVGYYLLAPLLAGVFLGVGIDGFLKTKPYFTFVFLILGMTSAFYNLYKITKEKF